MPPPRSISVADIVPVVVCALSTYGMKSSPYAPRSSSGTYHQMVASSTPGSHQASRVRRLRPVRVSTYSSAGSSAASVEAALTPPMNGMISAERAAATRGVAVYEVSGSSTQGSTAPGSAAAEVEPMTMV